MAHEGFAPFYASSYRRLPAWLRRESANPAQAIPGYSPETMRGAFRVALDQPGRAREFHLALCGSRTTASAAGWWCWSTRASRAS